MYVFSLYSERRYPSIIYRFVSESFPADTARRQLAVYRRADIERQTTIHTHMNTCGQFGTTWTLGGSSTRRGRADQDVLLRGDSATTQLCDDRC